MRASNAARVRCCIANACRAPTPRRTPCASATTLVPPRACCRRVALPARLQSPAPSSLASLPAHATAMAMSAIAPAPHPCPPAHYCHMLRPRSLHSMCVCNRPRLQASRLRPSTLPMHAAPSRVHAACRVSNRSRLQASRLRPPTLPMHATHHACTQPAVSLIAFVSKSRVSAHPHINSSIAITCCMPAGAATSHILRASNRSPPSLASLSAQQLYYLAHAYVWLPLLPIPLRSPCRATRFIISKIKYCILKIEIYSYGKQLGLSHFVMNIHMYIYFSDELKSKNRWKIGMYT